SQPTTAIGVQPEAMAEAERPGRTAVALLLLVCLLLAVVVTELTATGRPGWWWLPYSSLYVVTALVAFRASRFAAVNMSGSPAERASRSRAWRAMAVYALAVPAAILVGRITNQAPESAAGLLNDVIAF